MPAGSISGKLNLNGAGWSSAVDKAMKETKKLQDATRELGHGTVNSMQAASAAIRTLEGGMQNNIRAAERFISMVPGLGNVLRAAFPLVGAAAFAGVIYKIGEEASAAIKKVQQMPQAITAGFREMNASALTTNDTLRVTADRLESEIAKLQGKPQNNLQLAIDEARVAADKFAESLDRDNQKVKELLSQNQIGKGMALVTNRQSTDNISGTINSYNDQIAAIGSRYDLAVHGRPDLAGGTPAQIMKEYNDKRAAALAAMTKAIQDAKSVQEKPSFMNSAPLFQGMDIKGPGGAGVIAAATGEQATLVQQGDLKDTTSRIASDQAQRDKLQAGRDAIEASRRAAAELMQQWHKDLDDEKAAVDTTLSMEAQFWEQRAMLTKRGGAATAAAMDEANRVIARMRAENMRGNAEFDKIASQPIGNQDLSRGDTSDMRKDGRAAVEYLRNLNDGIQLQHANANAIEEASLKMGEMTGRISKLDAAQAMASLHAREYQDAISGIDQAIANAQNLPDGLDKKATIAGLNNQRSQATAAYQIQSAQDQQNISGNTIAGAAKDSLSQMVASFTDMATTLKMVIPRTIDSMNDDIVKLITGQGKKGDFGHTFMEAGQGLLKTGLQKAEGGALSFLTHGAIGPKRDGSSAQQALYVIQAAAMGAPASMQTSSPGVSAMLQMKDLIPGSAFIRPFMDFLPHFASGGDILANHPSVIGERGPELFVPRTAGTIVPNNQLGKEGEVHYHFHAEGATDPAATEAAMKRAIAHSMTGSMQLHHQMRMRTPQGR